MTHEWHNIGAGRVGDSYKGGKIVEIDHKNARAKVAKSKALKKKLHVKHAGGETKFAHLRGKNEHKMRGYETYKISKK